MRPWYLFTGFAVVSSALAVAPTAAADCTSASGTTICSQGDVRGADTGDGPSGAGPYMPYPCEYDYLCYGNNWGMVLDLDPGPGIGLPGTPGNRPGGGPGNRPGGGPGNRPGGGRG